MENGIIQDYINGMLVKDIIQKYHIAMGSLYQYLEKNNIPLRGKSRKYNFNIKKFKEDSQEKYYWLGFLMADGANVENRSLQIGLQREDENHLKKFLEFLESDAPILQKTNTSGHLYSLISINSTELLEYLSQNYGFVCRKTYNEDDYSYIPQEYQYDFARGLIDGDGCIRINNHNQISLSFVGNLEKNVNALKNILGIQNKTSFDRHGYRFQITGNKKALALLDKIYKNSSENTRLDRKYLVYKKKKEETNGRD